jgi:hypothetical protein
MMRFDLTKMPVSATLSLCLLAGLLTAAGCSETTTSDKRDDPALKAIMQKGTDLYKAKTQEAQQAKKGNSAPFKRPK